MTSAWTLRSCAKGDIIYPINIKSLIMATFRNYTTTPRRSDEVHYNPSYAWLGGDYNIGEWHLHADVDRELITLSHPAFHTVRMAGDKAREIFEELDDLYAADDLPAEDVWERYLSQYIRFTSDSKGVQAWGMVSRYKSRSKRAQVADSGVMNSTGLPVDISLVEKYGNRRVSSFSTADITSLFSAIFKSALQFKGYGSSFSFHRGGADSTARTLDFGTSILAPEGDETLTLEVPYDLRTSTISDVVEEAQRQYAKLLTSSTQSHPVSDTSRDKDTKYQPRRVSDNKVRRMRHTVSSHPKKMGGK